MAEQLKIPELGEDIDSGEVIKILVTPGSTLEVNQPVIELETGKATLEIPSTLSGAITELLVSEGDTVKVGQGILVCETSPSPDTTKEVITQAPFVPDKPEPASDPEPVAEDSQVQDQPPPPGPPTLIEVKVPDLGEDIDSGQVTKLLVAVGDTIDDNQPVIELETGKATLEIPSTAKGNVTKVLVNEGDTLAIGQVLINVEGSATAAPQPSTPSPSQPESKKPAEPAPAPRSKPASPPPSLPVKQRTGKPVGAAPSVRKFAHEIGIDINQVPGTGPRERISIADVKAYSKALNEGRVPAGPSVQAPPLPDFSRWGNVRRESMSTIRKLTAQHTTSCWSTIPHVTQHGMADITELELLRKRYTAKAEEVGAKLTPTAIFVKIIATGLKAFPQFNTSLDMPNHEIIVKEYVHIGVAVDTPKGLVVPVLKDADQKNIIELAVELSGIAEKARTGKMTPRDMEGGCFTISNLGGIGGTHFTPIVNMPEVAILGIGRASRQPVWVDGAFEPRLNMPLSLSYDHRVIDGADGARFLTWIIDAIHEPLMLALEG